MRKLSFSTFCAILLAFTACEKTGFQTQTSSANQISAFQKVLKSDNGTTFTIEATNPELLKGFNEASFQVEALNELPNASAKTKMTKQSTQITLPEQQVHIKVSNVKLPKGAVGYSVHIDNTSAKKGTVYVITDPEGNRRAASVFNYTTAAIFATNTYTRCEEDVDIDEDWITNGSIGIEAGYNHNFNLTPSKVYFNRIAYIVDTVVPGYVTISFTVPGSCNFAEGRNPAEYGEACNPFCTNCKQGTIPKETVSHISSFAANAKELRPILKLYIQHKPEIESLYLNNVEVSETISNLFNTHKAFIINSFSGNATTLNVLDQQQIADVQNLLNVIQQHATSEGLKTATADFQNQVQKLEGSTFKEALHKIAHH